MVEVTIIAAIIGGILSFFSPCVIPLIPGYMAYISGVSITDAKKHRFKVFMNALFFVLGFSVIFSIVGVLLFTVLDSIAYSVQLWLSRLGGIIIILFGLYMTGVFKIKYLERSRTLNLKIKNVSYGRSFIFGAAFAFGWSPCVGAVLGSVLALAITNPATSFLLLLAYSLGLGIPFLVVAVFSEKAMVWIKKSNTFFKYFSIIVGVLLIIMGILVFTQSLNMLANFSILSNLFR